MCVEIKIKHPHLHQTRTSKNGYQYEMTFADHEMLLKKLKSLSGSVVLSGYNNDLYNDHLNGWTKYSTNARAATQRGAIIRNECLWIKGNK